MAKVKVKEKGKEKAKQEWSVGSVEKWDIYHSNAREKVKEKDREEKEILVKARETEEKGKEKEKDMAKQSPGNVINVAKWVIWHLTVGKDIGQHGE